MNVLVELETFWQQFRWALFKLCPACAVVWRNRLWGQSKRARWVLFFSWGTAAFVLIHWLVNVFFWTSGGVRPSHQLHVMTSEILSLQARAIQVKEVEGAAQQQHLKSQNQLRELEDQSFQFMRYWPNSAHRMPLLSRLQNLAAQRGLHVVLLKSMLTPPAVQSITQTLNLSAANSMGLESTTLRLQIAGTERATFDYWQTLNRLLPNGLWTQLSWKLAPDGLYLLEGQLQLWWNPQDADTDTGVEVRWPEPLKSALRLPLHLDLLGHVFPGHSQAQMRVVGVGQRTASSAVLPTTSSSTSAAWTLVKSGNQILPVQVGQLLGIEKSKVTFTDAQGLWLASEGDHSQHLVAWEQLKP